jgi:hypothetical protein
VTHAFFLARLARAATFALLLCSCAATDVQGAGRPPAPEPAIAAVHRARCGACHVRVDPGTRTREVLTAALKRHRRRVHLSEAQWTALIDYLAPVPAG